jgi:hypothetical protein
LSTTTPPAPHSAGLFLCAPSFYIPWLERTALVQFDRATIQRKANIGVTLTFVMLVDFPKHSRPGLSAPLRRPVA